MSLEDFFTLTEMKDGLTTLPRVEELLSAMQNQKDSDSNNLGDATRQWATVASILSATENNDCLNHFVQLNGLLFLNQWLQEAQKGKENSSDCSVEEVINALLGALDKLPVNKEKSSASGIGPTIKQLLCYRNHKIQEKVRFLFDKWDHTEDGDSNGQTVVEQGSCCIEETKPSPARGIAEENKQSTNLDPKIFSSEEEPGDNSSRQSSSSSADVTKVVKHPSNQIPQHVLTSLDANVVSGEIYSYPCQESLYITEESVCPAAGEAGTCDSLNSRGSNSDDESDISSRKDTPGSPKDMEIEVNMEERILCKNMMESHCTISKNEAYFCKDDIGKAGDSTELDSDSESKESKGVDSVFSCASMRPTVDASMSEMDGRSEIGLGYGEIDALEVARQVAIEVEREVVDYREPFCSSPEGISQGKSVDFSNSDTMGNDIEKPVNEQLNESESSDTNGVSEDSDSLRNKGKTLGNVENNDACKAESPQSSLVQECVGNADKNKYEFDLNMDVCLEEADCQIVTAPNQNITLSTPIPVSASKGTPGFPVNLPHFQGGHGWRGSAATSAFRPASPWRTSDGEKAVSGPKQKPNLLRIDLNMTEGENDVVAYQLEKQTHVSSSIPSRESSMEVSSRRAERLRLDLNRTGDEDTWPNHIPCWRPHLQNPSLSLSPASSSSSRQPSTRDFDLNDNPSLFDACGSNSQSKSSKETNTYRNYMVDDSVVTIMGSRMPVERRLPVARTAQPFFVNGLGVDLAINSARGPVPYPSMPPPAFGYNALVMGPAISIPATFCGPGSIPYIVDPRGATVMPQMLGSAGLGGALSVRAPYVVNVAGAPAELNMVAASRPGLDLNSGTSPSEGSFRQFFIQGNNSKMDELRPTSQPDGSGMALKRKEPECGWEPCTFGYKQATPWH